MWYFDSNGGDLCWVFRIGLKLGENEIWSKEICVLLLLLSSSFDVGIFDIIFIVVFFVVVGLAVEGFVSRRNGLNRDCWRMEVVSLNWYEVFENDSEYY